MLNKDPRVASGLTFWLVCLTLEQTVTMPMNFRKKNLVFWPCIKACLFQFVCVLSGFSSFLSVWYSHLQLWWDHSKSYGYFLLYTGWKVKYSKMQEYHRFFFLPLSLLIFSSFGNTQDSYDMGNIILPIQSGSTFMFFHRLLAALILTCVWFWHWIPATVSPLWQLYFVSWCKTFWDPWMENIIEEFYHNYFYVSLGKILMLDIIWLLLVSLKSVFSKLERYFSILCKR